jgi:hypothetical protein
LDRVGHEALGALNGGGVRPAPKNAALSPVAKWQLCGGKVLPAPASEAVPDSFHAPVTQLSRAEIIFYYEAWGFELCGIGGGWAGSIAI